MGWSFYSDYGRDDIIGHLRKSLTHSGQSVRRSSAVGNSFWALLAMPAGHLEVFHAIIKGGTRRDPGWGYKDLSHRDGIDCPVEYLRFLPETEDARELAWREAVKAHHLKKATLKKKRESLKDGARVVFAGRQYELRENLGRRGWKALCLDDGEFYRMQTKQLSRALKESV